MSYSKIFLYICLSFVLGVFISSFIPSLSYLLVCCGLILSILLITILWKHKRIVIIGVFLLFFLFGILKHQFAWSETENNDLRKLNDSGEIVTLIGVVESEPDIRESTVKLKLSFEGYKGFVLVNISKYSGYQYSDKLEVSGKLETPIIFEDFNYKNYLAKDKIYSVMYYPKIKLLEKNSYKNSFSIILSQIFSFKNRLREVVYRNLSPPESSILGAIILGDKAKISKEEKEKLNIAGVRHITAVSGLHVAILTSILMSLLIGLGFWRNQAFYFSIIIISLFIILTGFQASAIRAGIMGGLFLFSQYLGRRNISSRILVFTATIMLFFNPLLLGLDIGFQLSFLAIIGIIYFLQFFRNLFKQIPNIFQIRNILAMTLSAQVFTLPILVYNFGYISLVSPITNILIIPLLPFVMISGFIFVLIGVISGPIALILSFPCWLLLSYITKVIDVFSSIPSLSFEISWIYLLLFYIVLGFITYKLQKRERLRFLDY